MISNTHSVTFTNQETETSIEVARCSQTFARARLGRYFGFVAAAIAQYRDAITSVYAASLKTDN